MESPFHKLKNIKPILIHEFGHLFGYCLANKSEITFFCKPSKIDLGYHNFITPSQKIYHIENLLSEMKDVFEETKNVKRTIAWFLEVISGCDFETEFEKTNFSDCFCFISNCTGSLDFGNLSVIRPLSYFNWTFEDIFDLQIEYRNLLNQFGIYEKIKIIVEDFLKVNGQKDFYIIENVELDKYENELSKYISEEMYSSYLKLILTLEKKLIP